MSNVDTGLASIKQIGTVTTSALAAVTRLTRDLALLNAQPDTTKPQRIQNPTPAVNWYENRRPAYYGGVAFAVLTSEALFGRRNAIHEYPFAETLWVEDIGRSARRITMTGFIVDRDPLLGGLPLDAQITALINVCETGRQQKLVHPTLGELNVGLLAPVSIREEWNKGRMVVLTFSFIENGTQTFPSRIIETPQNTQAVAVDASRKAIDLFAAQSAPNFLEAAAAAVQGVVNTTTSWANKALKLSEDATNIFGMASQFAAVLTPRSRSATTREQVRQAAKVLSAAAANLSPATTGEYGAAVQAFVDTVRATSVTGADALHTFTRLATTDVAPTASGAGVSQSVTDAVTVSNTLLRRMAVIAQAKATADATFTSYDEAIALLNATTALLDPEILYAGNVGDDAAFASLRALRAAVVEDLKTRGASLAPLEQFTLPSPLPASVVALRLYGDAGRADDLIARVKPSHPAFMPVSFTALSR